MGEYLGVALAAVDEDVVLNLVVTEIGVIVQIAQTLLGAVVNVYILTHALAVVLQRAEDVHGKREAYIAVHGGFVAQTARRHVVQTVYQTVVTGHLGVQLLNSRTEGEYGAVVVEVELGGLMAGIGEVEHVLGLLRVEHQRTLVAAADNVDQ